MTIDEMLEKAKEISNSAYAHDENASWYEALAVYQKASDELAPIMDEVMKLIDPRIIEILNINEDIGMQIRQLME